MNPGVFPRHITSFFRFMFVLCLFYVRPWFNHGCEIYITYIPRIYHVYITYLNRFMIYAWMIGRVYTLFTPYTWSNHRWSLLEPWSNIERIKDIYRSIYGTILKLDLTCQSLCFIPILYIPDVLKIHSPDFNRSPYSHPMLPGSCFALLQSLFRELIVFSCIPLNMLFNCFSSPL